MRALAETTDLAGVVTQPDRPAGRGQKLRPTPVKIAALELGVPVHQPASLAAFAREAQGRQYDLFALASYGKILPQALLDVPRLGSFNVHPSLLPRYRGATPIQSALRDGAAQTGVTIMLMDSGMDTGEIVAQQTVSIGSDESYGELHDRLADAGAALLRRAIDLAKNGSVPHEPQRGAPSVTRPISKDDLRIDWSWNAQRIVNAVRAFSPSPAARADLAGTTVKLLRAAVGPGPSNLRPGEVAGISGESLIVQCGEGSVAVLELLPPNKSVMTGAAFGRKEPARSA